ncbi:MAG: FecR domain-containing protein [Proteobacteria bacterium]|nr:FecR domain-containing protein [Pseudomonadota bacterium]
MAPGNDKSTALIVDEAAEWVVRMTAPAVSTEDKREFLAWLKRSPVHLDQYLRLERTWSDLARADPEYRIDIAALVAADCTNIVEFADTGRRTRSRGDLSARSGTTGDVRAGRSAAMGAGRRGRIYAIALAATLACVAFAVFWFHGQLAQQYNTSVGEQRTIRLEDGSTVVLNTDSRVVVDMSESFREVRLVRGEALFDVAKDRLRPFRVISDQAIAQAVGTSFIVRRKAQQTEITVIEGQVAVIPTAPVDEVPAARPEGPVQVSAGTKANVVARHVTTTAIENPGAVTAWRSGRLIFDGEPLANVIAEFNRYNQVQLVVTDSRLSGELISGVFDAGQPRSLVRFLEQSGAIGPPEQSGNNLILTSQ